jgi:large subunit ribosomal protein L24
MGIHIAKHDTVKVIAGDDRGKSGRVLRVERDKGLVLVEGVNFVKRHTRVTRQGQPGGIVQKESPVHISNVMVVCPRCGKATRVRHSTLAGGRKVRICKLCDEILEKEK